MNKPSLFKGLLMLGLFAFNSAAHAQLVDCSAFISGNYIQAGIAPNGAFGTAPQPVGYYGNTSTWAFCDSLHSAPGVGFIADPHMDGFTVGTPPFYGDYFTPGAPFEGWSVSIDGMRANAFATMDTSFDVPTLTGSNISYVTTDTSSIATWLGLYRGVTITQVTTLDTGALYFTIKITFTNTDTVAHNDIYYMRTVDPDNDEIESYSFVTNNKIVYQRPDSLNASVVTATGTLYPDAYLALGTADTNAKCLIYEYWPIDTDASLATIYADSAGFVPGIGTHQYVMGDSLNGDNAIALIFNIGHLAPVDSAVDSVGRTTASYHPANSKTITMFYSFGIPATLNAIAATTDTTKGTILSANNINRKPITIFPNPTTNNLTVTGLNPGDNVTLYNMMGAQVNIGTANNSNYSLSTIPTGTYIILIKDAQGNVRKKQTISKL